MRIYTAASYSRREEVLAYAEQLRQDGHDITAFWLTGIAEAENWTMQQCGIKDVIDIMAAECLLAFTNKDAGNTRGGHHAEFGIALALGLRLVICGERLNVFHHMPHVEAYPTFDECRRILKLAIAPLIRDKPGNEPDFYPGDVQELVRHLGQRDLVSLRDHIQP